MKNVAVAVLKQEHIEAPAGIPSGFDGSQGKNPEPSYFYPEELLLLSLPKYVSSVFFDPIGLCRIRLILGSSYRTNSLFFFKFLKKSSLFSYRTAIEFTLVDNVANLMRFYGIFILGSYSFNLRKGVEIFFPDFVSLQSVSSIFPALN
jgi:hypothetical protein